jgi:hypothetical protein
VVSFKPRKLYSRKTDAGNLSMGGWVDPTVDLDDVEKRTLLNISGLKLRHNGTIFTFTAEYIQVVWPTDSAFQSASGFPS